MKRTCRPRTGGGFTLIEVVSVLVIVAVLAAVAVPSMSDLSQTRVVLAARTLLHDLTFARQRALATGTPTWVVFSPASDTWSVLGEDPDNPGLVNASIITDMATGGPYTQTLGSGEFVGVELLSAVFDSELEIGFDWLGRPITRTGAALIGTGTVVLTSGHKVTVAPGTGHAQQVTP